MAEQAEHEDELVTDLEIEAPEGEETQADTEHTDHVEGEEPEDEVEILFGDEAAPASDEGQGSDLIRQLRAANREQAKKLSAYERGELQPVKVETIEVGDKPTLESCDYDETQFEVALDGWKDRKAKADEAHAAATRQQEQNQQAWQEVLDDFGRKKTALKAPNFDAAEEEVVSTLDQMQQAIVIKAADDSAKVIYALGRHPERLKTLAAIKDPIKFAVAITKLEGTLKVTTRRKAAEPDTAVKGDAQLSVGTDKELARLEKDAERTGDRSKVIAHKRRLKAQGRS